MQPSLDRAQRASAARDNDTETPSKLAELAERESQDDKGPAPISKPKDEEFGDEAVPPYDRRDALERRSRVLLTLNRDTVLAAALGLASIPAAVVVLRRPFAIVALAVVLVSMLSAAWGLALARRRDSVHQQARRDYEDLVEEAEWRASRVHISGSNEPRIPPELRTQLRGFAAAERLAFGVPPQALLAVIIVELLFGLAGLLAFAA